MKKLLVLFLLCSGTASADMDVEIDLSWVPPVENEDGTPLIDGDKFTIYWGNESGNYPFKTDVADWSRTSYTLPVQNVQSGQSIFIVMTASDTSANESGYSNEVKFGPFASRDALAPSVPAGLSGAARIVRCESGQRCSGG
jgi:hypothetical protein